MKPKVMIVDDEAVIREFVKIYLEGIGYEVTEAADAAALKEYIGHPAHVAVNEWMSPFLESRAVIDYEE